MLLRSSIFSIVGSVVQFVLSIGSGIIIARALGPQGKGQVFLVVQMAALGSMIFSFGLGSSYLFHLRKGIISGKAAIEHATVLLTGLTAFCATAYLLGLPLLRLLTGTEISDGLIAGMVALVVLNISTQFTGSILMHAEKGILWLSAFGIIGGLCYIASLTILVVYLHVGPLGAVISAMVPLLVRQILISVTIYRKMQLSPSFGSMQWTPKLVAYGLASFFGNLALTTACRVDTFIINWLIGPSSLGVYSVSVNVAELTLMVPAAIGVALFPRLTSQSKTDRVTTAALVARLSLCLGLVAAAGVGLFGYPVIALVFGDQFIGAYKPLLALLPGLVAMTTAYGYANFFSSLGRPLLNAAAFGVGIVLNVTLNLLVVPRYGIVGAGMVTSVSYIVSMVVFIVLISRIACVPWQSLVIPRRSDLVLIVGKLGGLLNSLLHRLRPATA